MNASFVSRNFLILSWFIILGVPPELLNAIVAESGGKTKRAYLLYSPTLYAGSVKFSLNLYKRASGFSYDNRTLTQMNRVLQLDGFKNADQANIAFQLHFGSFRFHPNYTLSSSNRMYSQKNYPLEDFFTETVRWYFQAGADFDIDFARGTALAERRINRWVEAVTNRAVVDFISPGPLISDTLNTGYFKGKWSVPFPGNLTNLASFHLADGRTVQVPTMSVKSRFDHAVYAPLKSQILRLNYEGNRVAMYIILPQEGIRLSAVRRKLNSTIVKDFMNKLTGEEMEVSLPKFQMRYTRELTGALRSLGMNDVFKASADLSRIREGPLRLSTVLHQAMVVVDEESTVAAAATDASCTSVLAPVPAVSFKVDRPCIYLIYDRAFQYIIFIGNLDDPSS